MADHEVAIIGAGPVGLLLACLLAQREVSVGVYERREVPSLASRAIGILPPGLRALCAVGIGSAVRAESLRIEQGVAMSGESVLAALPLGGRDAPALTLEQSRLEGLLRERLAELSPVALRTGMDVVQARDHGDRVSLRLEGEAIERTALILVAADGVRSAVRSQLRIGWRRYGRAVRYLMTDIDDSTDLGPSAYLFCAREGIVESFPLPGGQRRWVARVDAETTASSEALAAIIGERTAFTPFRGSPTTVTAFVARQHRAMALADGRIVLVGDAAHEVSPIGGQGMNLGWIGAMRLADDVSETLHSGRADFRRYQRAQLRSARRAHRRARFNMTMGRPARGPARLLRDLAARALGTRPLRGLALRAFTMRGLDG